jgi:hypothetical protein
MFYVPILSADDSKPILGNFPAPPTTSRQVLFYWTDPSELGVKDTTITVDGQQISISTDYLVGPIMAELHDALPADLGTHIITLGAFLTPLSTGRHTVEIHGKSTGTGTVNGLGSALEETFTYQVIVGE